MKLRKIRNVEISVCAGEQKVAYNFASMLYDVQISTEKAVELIRESTAKKEFRGYNIEAIVTAFINGFEQYRELKYHILTSYKEIGDIFKLKEGATK